MNKVEHAKALVTRTAHRLTAAILPWPPKAERAAAIEQARQRRLTAEKAAAQARVIADEIRAAVALTRPGGAR